ncbi:ABC transporter permease [Pelomicrobium sp.]|jgi:NitT/TauT family transport system permease protein|uniref:ABC transporter permease n=1 Tax=Pelomicrobium sp. TaxID=2815319 RepID=UPI002FDE47AA
MKAIEFLQSRKLWMNCAGILGFLAAWFLSVKLLPFESFSRMPDPVQVIAEWVSPDPTYGVSVFTETYYYHILYSTYRATAAFFLAVAVGVPLGILMGWNKSFHDFTSALLGLLRPIPPLAWIPLAILLLPGIEMAVIYVCFLVAFFATTLNTLVGVRSIDPDYFRAAACLGASRKDVLLDVIIPGALPNIFTGLQIAMGAAWFSLAAGEMIAAQYGLGFLIMEAYNLIQVPTIVIGMATLGMLGYVSSALIRLAGNRLMRWREEAIGIKG